MPTCSQREHSLCAKLTIALLAMLALCIFSPTARAENTAALTLQTAISLALENAPAVTEARSLENAARADLSQARRWQNPELGIEAENIFGNRDYKGTGAAELTIALTQPFELPGKRKRRLAVVAGDAEIGHQQADGVRIDTVHAVTTAFVEAAVAQQAALLMQAQLTLAEDVYKSVASKVDAGKEPPFQERKARIDLANTRMAAQQMEFQARNAREALRLLTGEGGLSDIDVSFLNKIESPRPAIDYITQSMQAPVMRSVAAAVKTAEAQASYAEVEWLPDPDISLGVRDMREDDSQALVLGLSMPIPLADRNTSGALAARERASAATAAQQKTRQDMEIEILRLHTELTAAYQALIDYREDILPAALTAADLTQRGYEAGKFQYIEMLDARRMLADSQQAENNALLAYHLRKVDLERLAGYHHHHAAEAHP